MLIAGIDVHAQPAWIHDCTFSVGDVSIVYIGIMTEYQSMNSCSFRSANFLRFSAVKVVLLVFTSCI